MSFDAVFAGGGRVRALELRRSATARRALLRVDPRDGAVRLTLPTRMSGARAAAWAETHRGWIEAQLARLPASRPIVPGMMLPWRGDDALIAWSKDAPRSVSLDGGTLRVGGPLVRVARRVLDWCRREALAVLTGETRAMAARARVAVGQVRVADPRSRWGSCTASGDIRYSWRLALAPRHVLSATVAHEVAHRLHMDHSAAFHVAVADILDADPAPATAWLRAHGATLHWIGAED